MHSRNYVNAIEYNLKLRKFREHIKNFRPNFLILTGKPSTRRHLVHFGQTLRESKSLIVYGDICIGDYRTHLASHRNKNNNGYLANKLSEGFENETLKIKGLYDSILAEDYRVGSQMLLQLAGLGGLKINTLVLGYKEQFWKEPEGAKDLDGPNCVEYVHMIRDCFRMGMNCMICRGLDAVDWHTEPNVYGNDDEVFSLNNGINTIDVWWLIDDGGLSLLVPYVLAHHKFWKKTRKNMFGFWCQ
eukprot:UN01922